jgi:hypothetical protein
MSIMNDTHGSAGEREYLWFAAVLMVVLVTVAAHLPREVTASELPEIAGR